jgi:hypothetical protein
MRACRPGPAMDRAWEPTPATGAGAGASAGATSAAARAARGADEEMPPPQLRRGPARRNQAGHQGLIAHRRFQACVPSAPSYTIALRHRRRSSCRSSGDGGLPDVSATASSPLISCKTGSTVVTAARCTSNAATRSFTSATSSTLEASPRATLWLSSNCPSANWSMSSTRGPSRSDNGGGMRKSTCILISQVHRQHAYLSISLLLCLIFSVFLHFVAFLCSARVATDGGNAFDGRRTTYSPKSSQARCAKGELVC